MSLLEDIFKPIFDALPRIEIPEFMDSSKGLTLKMKEGGGVQWIQKATKQMKKKGTVGLFTKKAKEHGLSAVAYAKRVIKSPQKHTNKTFKEAMFVKNANPELFAKGGDVSKLLFSLEFHGYMEYSTSTEIRNSFYRDFLSKFPHIEITKEGREGVIITIKKLQDISPVEKFVDIQDRDLSQKSLYDQFSQQLKIYEDEGVFAKGGKVKKMASGASVRYSSKRKGPSDSATWYSPGTQQLGNDGNWWVIKENVNGIHRWQKMKKGGKTQGYADRQDESLGMRRGKQSSKKVSAKGRRDDSYGKWGKRDSEKRGTSMARGGEVKTKRVKLKSGSEGERSRLHTRYDNLEDFESYSELYGLHERLGYDTPEEAWEDNPVVESGINPSDFRKVDKMAKGGKTQGYDDKLDESLGSRTGRRGTKSQSYKSRRDESKGTEKYYGNRPYSSVGTMDLLEKGGDVDWIQDVTDSPDFRKGAFTKKAKKRGLSPEAFMKKVLANPSYYDERTRKQAQFMKNI